MRISAPLRILNVLDIFVDYALLLVRKINDLYMTQAPYQVDSIQFRMFINKQLMPSVRSLVTICISGLLCPLLSLACNPEASGRQTNQVNINDFELSHFDNAIYNSKIHSIALNRSENFILPPYIKLASDQYISVCFDDFAASYKTYSYQVIHCDANWKPSSLRPSDYIMGFYENNINDVEGSFNTRIAFTHYRFEIPNNLMDITLSGNYLVVVYSDEDPASIAFTRRFVVFEQLVGIETNIKESTIISDRKYKQEVNFNISYHNYELINPYTDLQVVVLQNNRWDNALYGLKPKYVQDRKIIYDYSGINDFEGGNEYRFLDIKSMNYASLGIAKIEFDGQYYHVLLHPSEKRSYKNYSFTQDLNGRYFIRNDQGFENQLEAEYVFVHFSLKSDSPVYNGKVYVFGALSNYEFLDDFQMEYNYEKKRYERQILLKQGYYDFAYLTVHKGETEGHFEDLEGSHFSTFNEYCVFAYYRDPNGMYDRVVGASFLTNHK